MRTKETKEVKEIKRQKSLVMRGGDTDVNTFKKKVDLRRKTGRAQQTRKTRVQVDAKCERKNEKEERKELEVSRTAQPKSYVQWDDAFQVMALKRRKQERKGVVKGIEDRWKVEQGTKVNQIQKPDVLEWKEQVVRVGTGYRVRLDEKNQRKRRFDVGYSDVKEYQRKEGRQVTIDSSNIGRTVTGKGKGCRVKVMNAVCDMEKRRPTSEYTGSGILRKNRVGTRKLKSTKASGKE